MTQAIEMDATQLAELEKPWNIEEYNTYFFSYISTRTRRDANGYVVHNEHKGWLTEQVRKYDLHPVVSFMLATYRPKNVPQIALEYPHISDTDDMRISYTRNDADGSNDRVLVTSIGKYLARHWPHVKDDVRRDAAAIFTPDARVIVNTIPEIIRAVEDGPRSCMASAHGTISFRTSHREQMQRWFADPTQPEPPWRLHPYACYSPDLGWSMAQRVTTLEDGSKRIDGRALIYAGPAADDKRVFVRTYMRNRKDPVAGWSEPDVALHAWLERNGYIHMTSWPAGTELHCPMLREGTTDRRVPYMDGTWRMLMPVEGKPELLSLIHVNKPYEGYWGEHTSGVAQARFAPSTPRGVNGNYVNLEDFAQDNEYDEDDCCVCEDCGRYHHGDDNHTVGRSEDHYVCDQCFTDNYDEVRGAPRRGVTEGYITYYISSENSAWVECIDARVDPDHLPPDIVYSMYHGEYFQREDAVYVGDDWYDVDSEMIVADTDGNYQFHDDCVFTHDTEEYVLTRRAFQSETVDSEWFENESARDEFDAPEVEEIEEGVTA